MTTTRRFGIKDVVDLVLEFDNDFHDGLDAHVKVLIEGDAAVVALVPPGAIGEPSEPELFRVTVERIEGGA